MALRSSSDHTRCATVPQVSVASLCTSSRECSPAACPTGRPPHGHLASPLRQKLFRGPHRRESLTTDEGLHTAKRATASRNEERLKEHRAESPLPPFPLSLTIALDDDREMEGAGGAALAFHRAEECLGAEGPARERAREHERVNNLRSAPEGLPEVLRRSGATEGCWGEAKKDVWASHASSAPRFPYDERAKSLVEWCIEWCIERCVERRKKREELRSTDLKVAKT